MEKGNLKLRLSMRLAPFEPHDELIGEAGEGTEERGASPL